MSLSKNAIARALLIFGALLLIYTMIPKDSWGTEAPGCGDQRYRPRLAQCCPKYVYALQHGLDPAFEMPPKCTHALADNFLSICCTVPYPTETPPSVEPTPQPTFPCSESTVAPCSTPSPLPTPISRSKGECCKEVRSIYAEQRRTIVVEKNARLRELVEWRKGQMEECREDYAQP